MSRFARWSAFGSLILSPCLFAFAAPASADDWPQWMGPHRDATWSETGVIDAFPESGPKVKWRVPVGYGYAGPAVADGKVYVADFVKTSGELTNNPGTRDRLTGQERLLCLDAKTGKQLWAFAEERQYAISYPGGPRCTPTVDGDLVFFLGAEGDLVCLKTADGSVVWKKKLTEEYKTETPIWGFAAHPLVVGDLLYCVVGGQGSVAVAFDKRTGKEVWRALSAPEPGYCPPTLIEQDGKPVLAIWHPEALNGLDLATGKVLWTVPLKPSYGMSIMAPRQEGDVLFAAGIGNVGAAIRLPQSDGKPSAIESAGGEPEVLWRSNVRSGVYPVNSTPYLLDGVIYGNDGESGGIIAAKLADGERLWQSFEATTTEGRPVRQATVFLVRNADRFFLFNDQGELIIAKLSPEGYEEVNRAKIVEPTEPINSRTVVWSHPAFADRACFARSDKEIVCVDLAK